jgi:hypothetical protein
MTTTKPTTTTKCTLTNKVNNTFIFIGL